MDISKQLFVGLLIGFMVGSAVVYGFMQYTSLTSGIAARDKQISDLQTYIEDLESQLSQLNQTTPQNNTSPSPTPTEQEKVAIQALSGNATTGAVTIYAQSIGGGPVSLDSAILKDNQGAVLQVVDTTDIVNATLSTLTIGFNPTTMNAGSTYTVTLVTKIGGSFVSQSFKAT